MFSENIKFDYKVKKAQPEETKDGEKPTNTDLYAKPIERTTSENFDENNPKLKEEIQREVKKWKLKFINNVQEIISLQQPEINGYLIRNFAKLGEALGSDITENHLIHHIISFLNDSKYKLISLQEIEKLIDFLSQNTITGLMAVLDGCMFDTDEMIVFQSVKNFNKTVRLNKINLKDPALLVKNFLPLIIHPNSWIREQVIDLFCQVLEKMDIEDLYFQLQPALLMYVKAYEVTFLLLSLC